MKQLHWWKLLLSHPVVLTGPSPLVESMAGRKYHYPAVWIMAKKGIALFCCKNMDRKRACSLTFRSRTHRECIVKSTIWFSKCFVEFFAFVSTILLSAFGKQKTRAWTHVAPCHVQALDNLSKLVLDLATGLFSTVGVWNVLEHGSISEIGLQSDSQLTGFLITPFIAFSLAHAGKIFKGLQKIAE